MDDIISIIIFIAFVVGPILSRLGRQQKPPNPPPPGSPTPQPRAPTPRQQPPQALPPQRPVAQQQQPHRAPVPMQERNFERMLNEARRRVEQAARETGEPSAPQTQPSRATAQQPKPSTQSPPPSQRTQHATAAQRPPYTRVSREGQSLEGHSLETLLAPSTTSDPLRVTRLKRQSSISGITTKKRHAIIGTSSHDLLQGLIWKQILDPPRSRQPHAKMRP